MKRIVTQASVAAAGLLVMAVAPAGQRPSVDVLEKTIPGLRGSQWASGGPSG